MVKPALLSLLALLLVASPATAAEVSTKVVSGVAHRDDDGLSIGVEVVAGPGEGNDVRLEFGRGTVLVRDAGAPLRPGDGCRAEGDAVRCTATRYELDRIRVDLGDGDDRYAGDPTPVSPVTTVLGGPGADELRDGAGFALLDGGPGDDLLAGGGGSDGLHGGDGTDTLLGGPGEDRIAGDDQGVAPDRIDGGPGVQDRVVYAGRPAPVRVDLGDPGTDGADGEGDILTGVESVEGSPLADDLRAGTADAVLEGGDGDDALTGGAGEDTLAGYDGDDRLAGGDGADRLAGWSGADRLDGGGGADRLDGDHEDRLISAGSGGDTLTLSTARRVDCGPGVDTVFLPPSGMLIPASCEAASTFGVTVVGPRVTRSALVFGVRFDDDVRRGTVLVSARTAGGRKLGARVRSFGARGGRLRIPLDPRLRRAVLRGAALRVVAQTAPRRGGSLIRYRIAPVQ